MQCPYDEQQCEYRGGGAGSCITVGNSNFDYRCYDEWLSLQDMKKPKPGSWESRCAHANEVPNVCPCPDTWGCKYYHCSKSTGATESDRSSLTRSIRPIDAAIPMVWIQRYIDELLKEAVIWESGPMHDACIVRSEHAMDIIIDFLKSQNKL